MASAEQKISFAQKVAKETNCLYTYFASCVETEEDADELLSILKEQYQRNIPVLKHLLGENLFQQFLLLDNLSKIKHT